MWIGGIENCATVIVLKGYYLHVLSQWYNYDWSDIDNSVLFNDILYDVRGWCLCLGSIPSFNNSIYALCDDQICDRY